MEPLGLRVVALLLCEIGQVADGHREKPDVASCARKLRALCVRRCRSLVVAEPGRLHTQADQGARDTFCVFEAASERESLLR